VPRLKGARHGFQIERVLHTDTPCWHVARFHGDPFPKWTGEHYQTLDEALDAATPIVGELRGRFRVAPTSTRGANIRAL
jgi:hypothetical protein